MVFYILNDSDFAICPSFVRVQTNLPIGSNLGVLFISLLYFVVKFLIITYFFYSHLTVLGRYSSTDFHSKSVVGRFWLGFCTF